MHEQQSQSDEYDDEEIEPVREPTRREKYSILAVAFVAYVILIAMCLIVLGIYLANR